MKIFIWPDSTWCFDEELPELDHLGTDYEVHEINGELDCEFDEHGTPIAVLVHQDHNQAPIPCPFNR